MTSTGPICGWAGGLLFGVGVALVPHGEAGPLVLGTGLAMVLTRTRGRWNTREWSLSLLLAVLAAGRADDALRPAAPEGASLQARVTDPWRTRGGLSLDSGGRGVRLAVEPDTLWPGDEVVLRQPRPGRRAASPPEFAASSANPVTQPPELSALPEDIVRTRCGDPVGAGLLRRLRERGLGACARHPDPDTAGLLAALLFGDTSRLPRGLADLFTRTGTRHLLALSGLHVALLAVLLGVPLARAMAAIATFALRVLGARRSVGPAVPLALLAAVFVPLSGAGAPASRAALALACAALAPRLPAPRRPRALDLLGVALVIEVLVDPIAAARPGVQLSYLATAALVAVAPAAAPRIAAVLPGLREPAPVRGSGRRRRPLPRALHLTVARILGLGTGASVVATIATLPVIWSVFGEASWAGIVLTTLAMPAVTALIAGGWTWIAAPDLFPGEALTWCARGLVALHTAFDHFPGTPLVLPARPLWAIASASGLAIAALRTGNGRAGRLAALAFGLLIAPLPIGAARPPGALEVHVMDVGDGTAIVARAPGTSPLLVDAGSRDRSAVARAAVGPLLRALDAGPLRIVLTHDHADHARDLPWLARRFGAARWIGPLPAVDGGRSLGPPPWRGATLAGQVERSEAPDGLRVVAGGPFEGNEGSLVAELTCPTTGARVVLSGDAEAHGLEQLLEPGGLSPGPIAALLLPHHGSRSRHLGRLLDHLEPREVWVSASEVPSTAAIECDRRGISLRTTGVDGAWTWRAGVDRALDRSQPISAD